MMHFVPYHQLGAIPNLIVDGPSNPATICNLSHWPHSGTRTDLRDDLSAQIVFHYLDRPELHVEVTAVSNDHFDEDGLVSLYAVLYPADALKLRDFLIDIARAGDFAKYRSREAARVAFVLSAYSRKDLSPLEASLFDQPYPDYTAAMYNAMLPLLPDIIEYPKKYAAHSDKQEAFLDRSEEAVRAGRIHIEQVPELDLAVVTVPDNQSGINPGETRLSAAYHPMSINNATDCFRILLMQGKRYELYFRYESWVQYMSRRPLPRVDLTPLSKMLSLQEDADSKWIFDGVSKMTPCLRLVGTNESRISPDHFRRQVLSFLAEAPPAWNPYE